MSNGRRHRDEHREVADLRGGREDVREGRRFLTDVLVRLGWEDRIDDATLLLSELLANVALHARTDCSVTVIATPNQLRVEVEDGSPTIPRVQHFAIDTTTGRGLRVVDQVSESWGVQPTPRGKSVWFSLHRLARGSGRSVASTASAGARSGDASDAETLLDQWDGWEEAGPAFSGGDGGAAGRGSTARVSARGSPRLPRRRRPNPPPPTRRLTRGALS